MQKVAVLGSTGSIGTNTLDVISRLSNSFKVEALSTNSNIGLLLDQVKRFNPRAVCVVDIDKAREFKRMRCRRIRVYEGEEGLCRMSEEMSVDTLVVGIVGAPALLPILKALPNIKRLALANKEALVMAGDIVMEKLKRNKVKIVPVDSEHSAIFQCLASKDKKDIKNIYLTGSGGPLRCIPKGTFKNITACEAINHPKWKMGKKISIDSATMMNKGLEVIEAHHLFGLDIDKIKVLIHPETAVHSMVEFIDGSILAQLGTCDMRIPIQYALTYPSRAISPARGINLSELGTLHFYKPDARKFPCLEIAYGAARRGRTYPCVLNAANEIAVSEFLKGVIRFTDIPRAIEKVLESHKAIRDPELKDILEIDKWARIRTKEVLGAFRN
jgi:1-deoxy-D-xylulose-5-phosphate reductoisomerase